MMVKNVRSTVVSVVYVTIIRFSNCSVLLIVITIFVAEKQRLHYVVQQSRFRYRARLLNNLEPTSKGIAIFHLKIFSSEIYSKAIVCCCHVWTSKVHLQLLNNFRYSRFVAHLNHNEWCSIVMDNMLSAQGNSFGLHVQVTHLAR